MTVRGPIAPAAMGVTLPHEHLRVNFQPLADRASQPLSWSPREVVSVSLPHLRRIRRLGCRTPVDATPIALGRHPLLLRSLSKASGLQILTPTGNYAARSSAFLPPYLSSDSPQALAARWIAEFRHGIDSIGVRPGFLKLGFQGGPLSPLERKLILAAALAHLDTGLTIASHTGPAVAALEQLATFDSARVSPSAWIWVHPQAERDPAPLLAAARRGAWISLDGLAPQSLQLHPHPAAAFSIRPRPA